MIAVSYYNFWKNHSKLITRILRSVSLLKRQKLRASTAIKERGSPFPFCCHICGWSHLFVLAAIFSNNVSSQLFILISSFIFFLIADSHQVLLKIVLQFLEFSEETAIFEIGIDFSKEDISSFDLAESVFNEVLGRNIELF